MWNFLIVTIIAIAIFAFNPLSNSGMYHSANANMRTKEEIDRVVTEVEQQVKFTQQTQLQQTSQADFK